MFLSTKKAFTFFIRHIKSGKDLEIFKDLNIKKQRAACKKLYPEHNISKDQINVSEHHQKEDKTKKKASKTTGFCTEDTTSAKPLSTLSKPTE